MNASDPRPSARSASPTTLANNTQDGPGVPPTPSPRVAAGAGSRRRPGEQPQGGTIPAAGLGDDEGNEDEDEGYVPL
jgi:hypothetical protein